MTDALVNAFRTLSTSDSRKQALDNLTLQLSPYEWRFLHAILDARSFQFDIVGNLPVEIVALIFSHLDPAAPYRFQHVSRKWQFVLSSLPVLTATLCKWHDLSLQKYAPNADHDFCIREARRIHNFRTGNLQAFVKLNVTYNTLVHPVYLFGHHLVWTAYERSVYETTTYALNLREWKFRTLIPAGRERIQKTIVSEDIILVITYATTCYAWPLRDPDNNNRKSFRVPHPSYTYHMSCRGHVAACAKQSDDDQSLSVYVWDFETQHGKTFTIREDPSHLFFSIDSRYDLFSLIGISRSPENGPNAQLLRHYKSMTLKGPATTMDYVASSSK